MSLHSIAQAAQRVALACFRVSVFHCCGSIIDELLIDNRMSDVVLRKSSYLVNAACNQEQTVVLVLQLTSQLS